MTRFLLALVYVGTVWAANQAVAYFGLIPVGFGLLAPAGTLFAAAALILRDEVQQHAGKTVAILAVLVGAALSYVTAGPALALASGAAFLAAELVDMAVFTLLARRPLRARLLSNTIGGVLDTWLFLTIAGFPLTLDTMGGQLLVKLGYATIVVALWMRLRDRYTARPAVA